MHTKTIVLVGPGRLGASLAHALKDAGFEIREIVCRSNSRSRAEALRLARAVNTKVSIASNAELNADVIWFCVPDVKIAGAAKELANRDWRRKIALHSSGALSSDALDSLRRKGASVASVHPLMTFVHGSRPSLAGVPFAIEGDGTAERIAYEMVRSLRGEVFRICKQDKLAYHAFATIICPLLVSLLAASERVAALTGASLKQVRRRMMPIIRQTIANYEQMGAAASFSGPIVRGDTQTIARHVKALRKIPEAEQVYIALAKAALKYLPNSNRNQIKAILFHSSQIARRNEKGKDRARMRRARQR